MTKEEARKSLFNTKVYVDGKSKELQEKLFKLGFTWDNNRTKPSYMDEPFLFIGEDSYLTHGSGMEYYKDKPSREVTAEYILNLEWDEEKKDTDGEDWKQQFVEHVQNSLSEYRNMTRAMTQRFIDESNRIFEQIKKDETDYEENKRFRKRASDAYNKYSLDKKDKVISMIVDDIENLIKGNERIVCINVRKPYNDEDEKQTIKIKTKMNISEQEIKRQRLLLEHKKELEKKLSDIKEISSLGLRVKMYRNAIGSSEAKEVEIDSIFVSKVSELLERVYEERIDNINKEVYG